MEARLAAFVGMDGAPCSFSTGFMANIGVMPALLGRGDAIFADKLNHASLVDGALLSRAELIRYPHNDVAALAARLAASRRTAQADRHRRGVQHGRRSRPPARTPRPGRNPQRLAGGGRRPRLRRAGPAGPRQPRPLRAAARPRILYMGTLGKAAGVARRLRRRPARRRSNGWCSKTRSYIFTTGAPPAAGLRPAEERWS